MADNIYDFNAPQHYFDFKDILQDEPDDSYFDCHDGSGPSKLQTPQVEGQTSKPLRASKQNGAAFKKPLEGVTPKRAPAIQRTPMRKAVEVPIPKNPLSHEMEVDSMDQNEDKENTPMAHGSSGSPENGKQIKTKSKSFSPGVGVRSSPRLVAIAKAIRRSNAARRSAGSGSRKSSGSSGSSLGLVNKQKTQRRPLVPKVQGVKGLSEQDRSDLASIATFKQKMVKNRKKGEQASAAPRLAPTVPHEFKFSTDARLRQKHQEEPVVAPKPAPLKAVRNGPTRPQEFNFATDSRIKGHASAEEETTSFPNSLRSGSNSVETHERELPKGPTIPQPFKLTETRKTTEKEMNKFVSVAELNLKFHTRTPQRYRTRQHGEDEEALNQNKKKSRSGVTIPVTPNFSTKTRSRQVSYLTREEMEQKEFEEEQKHKFKANPVNKNVFKPPPEGVHTGRKTSTIPEPFKITKTKKEETPFGNNFKEMSAKFGSNASISSLPWGGVPSKWEKTSTTLQPFSFDNRDKYSMQRKQKMIEKVKEDEKKLAEFHAQPMPIFEAGIRGVPEKKPPTPTRLNPFNLRSDQRGEHKKEEMHRQREEEERLDRERRAFHARSDAVVHKEPFLPEKSKKPLTDISGFTLNTEVRAEARTEFELQQKKKELELLAAKKEREERQAAEEAEEIVRMRREAVHKANPIRNYKPVEIKPAPCPPTVPISPNFATKTRLRSRMTNPSSANSSMNISSATFTTE